MNTNRQMIHDDILAEFKEIRIQLYNEFRSFKFETQDITMHSVLLLECAVLYLIQKTSLELVEGDVPNQQTAVLSFKPTEHDSSSVHVLASFPKTSAGAESKRILSNHNLSLTNQSTFLRYISFCLNHFTSGDVFGELSDRIFKWVFQEKEGEYIQPHEVTSIVNYLVHKKESLNVYNPFGGFASYGVALPSSCNYSGQDSSSFAVSISIFRLAFCGKERAIFYCADSIMEWLDGKFDVVLSTPDQKLALEDLGEEYNPMHYYGINNWILDKSITSITDDGQIILVLARELLFAEQYAAIRKRIIDLNLLDLVILLPPKIRAGFFMGNLIISLRKGRSQNDPIKLFDAQNYYTAEDTPRMRLDAKSIIEALENNQCPDIIEVSTEQISNNGYLFTPSRYLIQINVPEGYQLVELKDIAKLTYPNFNTRMTEGKLLDYSGEIIDVTKAYLQEREEFEDEEEEIRENGVEVLTEPTLLLTYAARSLSLLSVDASKDNPIMINGWSLAKCELNEKRIDREYLEYLFERVSSDSIRQIFGRTDGGYKDRFGFNTVQLLQFSILPSVEDQRRALIEIERAELWEEAKAMGFETLLKQKEAELERTKTDYLNEVRNRKHDMKTPMTQLRNTLSLLDHLALQLSGEFSSQLKEYSSRQRVALDALSEIVQHIADEDIFAEPEPVDIDAILSSQVRKTDRYVIEYHRDEAALKEAGIKKAIVNIGKVDFIRLVENVVGNAIKHGFKGQRADYALHISLSIDGDFFIIHFSNNGEPLPEGMDKTRYGLKSIKSKDSDGSGIGGYVVKSVSQHYGGDYDISSGAFIGQNYTNVIVKLPIFSEL